MKDYLTIGATPVCEKCQQLGAENYTAEKAKKECSIFIEQLRRVFGPEPPFTRLAVKGFSHDFGTYYEVVCHYDTEREYSVDYAFKIEGETPEYWDDEAREEIRCSKLSSVY